VVIKRTNCSRCPTRRKRLFKRVVYFFSGGGEGRTAKEDGKIGNKANGKYMALCV
jgi:hypothetical protein